MLGGPGPANASERHTGKGRPGGGVHDGHEQVGTQQEGGQGHRAPVQAAFPGMCGPGLYAGHDNNDEGEGQRPGEQLLARVEHSPGGLLVAIGRMPQPIPQPPGVAPVEAEQPAH